MPKGSAFDLDEGFENIPVVQAPAHAVNKVANTGTKYTKQQAAAMAKSFVSQLYGSTAGTATDDDQQQDVQVNAAAKAQKAQVKPNMPKAVAGAHIQHHAIAPQSATATAATPEEQEKLAEARRQLYQHSTEYYDATFGNTADVESEVIKEAQKRKQREDERKQEQEEEEKQKMQELEQKKKELPIAVTRARNKAESNRGVSG